MNGDFNIGDRLHELRTAQGQSQEQLALRSGITTTYLGLIERNLKNPTIKVMEQLCCSLNISLSDFFNVAHKPSPSSDSLTNQITAQLHGRTEKLRDLPDSCYRNSSKT